jgi:hypothetical protein
MKEFKRSLQIRKAILSDSLALEEVISRFLALFLGIKDSVQSYSFGNSSKALSLNKKIFLLIDLGALDDSTKGKFIKFMEIRNQFMHNFRANNFQEVLSFIDGAEKYLLKNYKQDANLDIEVQLNNAYRKLLRDIFSTTDMILERITKKIEANYSLELAVLKCRYLEDTYSIKSDGVIQLFKDLKSNKDLDDCTIDFVKSKHFILLKNSIIKILRNRKIPTFLTKATALPTFLPHKTDRTT